MSELTVERFMTHAPHTIGQDQPLRSAYEMMRRYHVRHLPVLHGGKLVGIVSQRDLYFIETLSDVDPAKVPVSEAMSTDTYVVGPRSPLRTVAAEMAEHHYGSVVVMEHDRIIGILTMVDGMRALSLVLGEQRLAEQRLAEQRLAEQQLTEQCLTEQRLAEQQLAEQHLPEQPAAVSGS